MLGIHADAAKIGLAAKHWPHSIEEGE